VWTSSGMSTSGSSSPLTDNSEAELTLPRSKSRVDNKQLSESERYLYYFTIPRDT
jgi:hypothetical protein